MDPTTIETPPSPTPRPKRLTHLGDGQMTVTILGAQHVVTLPSLGLREDLVIAWGTWGQDPARARRVYAAAVGASTGLGGRAGASWARSKYDVLEYGDRVYSWLREQETEVADIVEAGAELLGAMSEGLFPREEEVVEASGFSEGDGAEPTSSPSA